ncbi:hypothetical protein VULLAG_LOCUS12425 [Vulpes lagopus]
MRSREREKERDRETERQRQRHRQREKQAPSRDPDVGLHPGSPGSRPGPKVALNHGTTQAALLSTFKEALTWFTSILSLGPSQLSTNPLLLQASFSPSHSSIHFKRSLQIS